MNALAAAGEPDLLDRHLAELLLSGARAGRGTRAHHAALGLALLLSISGAALVLMPRTSDTLAPLSRPSGLAISTKDADPPPGRVLARLPVPMVPTPERARRIGLVMRQPVPAIRSAPLTAARTRAPGVDLGAERRAVARVAGEPASGLLSFHMPPIPSANAGDVPEPITNAAAKVRRKERQDAIDAIRTLSLQ